ncbi:type IV toxin-antitoxin system AbiEi family antitoxin [Desulfuromonas thiophila]|uniref:type IV toxin-antitoxin system AbiEi family antitoxin n=1 Tax=Desulfuromonas thiophila TaxID=57664 RepID=UPI0024A8DD5B|nr:type IV toxin-antitoxin system AbiEi family antitoxin domain-containing protein [Desulfuromonas thiophila]
MSSAQPLSILSQALTTLADSSHYLFRPSGLRPLLPELSAGAFKTLLSRAESAGLLRRVCRGIYLYPHTDYPAGLILYHTAALLRSEYFNYLSLESVLSELGIMSQLPLNWITLMSSGRSNQIDCREFGTIEFVHTCKLPENLVSHLVFDARYHLWRADSALALQDMKDTRRSLDLVDMESLDEYI